MYIYIKGEGGPGPSGGYWSPWRSPMGDHHPFGSKRQPTKRKKLCPLYGEMGVPEALPNRQSRSVFAISAICENASEPLFVTYFDVFSLSFFS